MDIVGDTLAVVTVSDGRKISGIFPDVVIEESHNDSLTITEHPTGLGAPMTDHAYKNAAEFTMRVGWSNSKSNDERKKSGVVIETIADAYAYLLKLQASRQPFDVITGKRAYKNVLIKSLTTSTDRKTNEVLDIVVSFRQLIVVNTQTAKILITNQANPKITVPIQNTGAKNPLPVVSEWIAKPLEILNLNKGL